MWRGIIRGKERDKIMNPIIGEILGYACGEKMGEIKNCQCFHFVLDDGKWEFVDFFDTGITVQNKSDMPK